MDDPDRTAGLDRIGAPDRVDDLERLDDLERMLLSEEPLEPSSGFAAAVMDSVHEAATEPPPLAFPWMRFAAGAIACAVWAASAAAMFATLDFNDLAAYELTASLRPVARELGYAAAAVLASFALLGVRRVRNTERLRH